MVKSFIVVLLMLTSISTFSQNPETSFKLIVFEGSDWCPNCIRFNNKIISSKQFSDFAESQNITTEHIDFPQRKKLDQDTKIYNAEIADKYKFNGVFPTILLVETNSEQIIELRYSNQDPEEFIALIKSKIYSEK